MKRLSKGIDKRLIYKSLSWRAIATVTTLIVSWLVTGSLTLSLSIAGFEVIVKTLIYYVHEMIWKEKKEDET